MKAKILSGEAIDESTNLVHFQIIDDSDKVIFEGKRGFVSLSKDKATVIKELTQSLKNVRDSEIQKKESQMTFAVNDLVGTELDIA